LGERAEISRSVQGAAYRLRLAQTDLMDESASVREEYLLKELQQAMADVLPQDRRDFLKELASRFPTWEQGPASPVQRPPSPPADPHALANELSARGQNLPEAQRADILDQLRRAWGLPLPPAEAPAGIPPFVQMLVEFVHTLDPLVNKTWTTINPGGKTRRVDWQKQFAQCGRGGHTEALSQQLLELRQLTAALLIALPALPVRFQENHLGRFRPEDIEQAVQMGGSILNNIWGKPALYWEQFKKLAPALEEGPVQASMFQIIIELVDSIRKGAATRANGG